LSIRNGFGNENQGSSFFKELKWNLNWNFIKKNFGTEVFEKINRERIKTGG
jgi:hypothetical protein